MLRQPIRINLDTAVIRLTAIKKAAYKFGGRFYVEISLSENSATAQVSLSPKHADEDLSSLIGDFQNEALDQELRELIGAETLAVRNVLMAQAFSSTALLDPIGERSSPIEDPLGISESDVQADRGNRQSE